MKPRSCRNAGVEFWAVDVCRSGGFALGPLRLGGRIISVNICKCTIKGQLFIKGSMDDFDSFSRYIFAIYHQTFGVFLFFI